MCRYKVFGRDCYNELYADGWVGSKDKQDFTGTDGTVYKYEELKLSECFACTVHIIPPSLPASSSLSLLPSALRYPPLPSLAPSSVLGLKTRKPLRVPLLLFLQLTSARFTPCAGGLLFNDFGFYQVPNVYEFSYVSVSIVYEFIDSEFSLLSVSIVYEFFYLLVSILYEGIPIVGIHHL
jgi:hypothetical protein